MDPHEEKLTRNTVVATMMPDGYVLLYTNVGGLDRETASSLDVVWREPSIIGGYEYKVALRGMSWEDLIDYLLSQGYNVAVVNYENLDKLSESAPLWGKEQSSFRSVMRSKPGMRTVVAGRRY
jgi:hypothetical protein